MISRQPRTRRPAPPVSVFPSPYARAVAPRPAPPPGLGRAAAAAVNGAGPVTAAAGFAYESKDPSVPDFKLTPDQIEVDGFVDSMGWVGFYVQVKAMLGSMCPWFVEERVGSEWVPAEDPRIQAMASLVQPASRSQMGMRYRSLSLQARLGEHAFWPVVSPQRGLCFDLAHPKQLRRGQVDGVFGVATRRDANPSAGFGYQEFPIERLRRHWIPDDSWPDDARVRLAPTLTEMRLYRSIVLNLGRAADSRLLMNGLLWVSTDDGSEDGGSWVADTAGAFDPDDMTPEAPTVGGGIPSLIEEFSRFGARAFRDHLGQDVASRLPFPFPHHTKPEHIELGRAIDPEVLSALTDVVFAAGRGLDIPTQYLVSGEASSNHWNDAELRRALHERAIYPELGHHDEFWSGYALRPLMAMTRAGGAVLGDNDPDDYRLRSDTSVLDIKSDSLPHIALAAQLGIPDRAWLADKLGVPEDRMLDVPVDITEYEHWVYSKLPAAAAADGIGVTAPAGAPALPAAEPVSAAASALIARARALR